MAAGNSSLDAGTISGRIELDDLISSVLDRISAKLGDFDNRFGETAVRIGEGAASFISAQAIISGFETALHTAADVISDLSIQGAKIGDVEDNFDHMTAGAGRLSETLLGALREGTHNTIDDFNLTKIASQDLTAGMNLTDKQFKDIATGGFALAQARGIDVKDALETVNDALLTGRVRQLAYLTGKIDLAKAEQDFAAKLGTTTDHLSAEGKLEADRTAILDSVSAATSRLGVQTDGLDEKVDQIKTKWNNFYDTLAKSVAQSPVLAAGLDAVGKALGTAFGDKQTDAIQGIKRTIEEMAIAATSGGALVVNVFRQIGDAIFEILPTVEKFIADQASFALAMSNLPGTIGTTSKAIGTALLDVVAGMSQLNDKQGAFDKGMDATAAALGKGAEAMRQALAAEKPLTDATDKQSMSVEQQNAILAHNQLVLAQTEDEAKKMAAAQAELASVGADYHDTLARMDQELVVHVEALLKAGASAQSIETVYKLTAAQVKALEMAIKDETEAQKLEQKQLSDSSLRWAEYNDLRVSLSHDTTAKENADIQKWEAAQVKAHMDAKTDTADFYNWLDAQSHLLAEKAEQSRLESDTHSKAYWQAQADEARDAYEFAREHADQFTASYIQDLKDTSDAAAVAAANWEVSMGGSLDNLTKKVMTLNGQIVSFEDYMKQQNAGFSFDVPQISQYDIDNTPGGATALLKELNNLEGNIQSEKANLHSIDDYIAYNKDLVRYQSLKNAYDLISSEAKKGNAHVPSFATGGEGDFGDGTLAMLHGHEAIIPMNGPGGVGGMSLIFYVNGTGQQVADQVSQIMMGRLKNVRQYPAA